MKVLQSESSWPKLFITEIMGEKKKREESSIKCVRFNLLKSEILGEILENSKRSGAGL